MKRKRKTATETADPRLQTPVGQQGECRVGKKALPARADPGAPGEQPWGRRSSSLKPLGRPHKQTGAA